MVEVEAVEAVLPLLLLLLKTDLLLPVKEKLTATTAVEEATAGPSPCCRRPCWRCC